MPIRLGIDASQSAAGCAIATDTGKIVYAEREKPIENFPTLIRDTLALANISLNDIDEIVVCIGPGSQMGIRTAVVTGNALALALNKPISGVFSTDAAAILSKSNESFQVAVSAGRRRWYVEEYRWQEGKLNRLDTLKLVDDLPENTNPSFCGGENRLGENQYGEDKICAYGILMVAGQQRHLVSQSLLDEVRP